MNCLIYLLELLSQGVQMKILYNGDHCIGDSKSQNIMKVYENKANIRI